MLIGDSKFPSFQDDNESVTDSVNETGKSDYPKVSLSDIIGLRKSGKPLRRPLFMRYRCNLDDGKEKLISESKVLGSIVEGVKSGFDPYKYAAKETHKWSGFSTSENVDNLIERLNSRGLREVKLKSRLEKATERVRSSVVNCVMFRAVSPESKPARVKHAKGDIIDKSLFKTMDDYLEANLRDQLVDFEERLWQGSLCVLKVDDREAWRESIVARINQLLCGYVEKISPSAANRNGDARNGDDAIDCENSGIETINVSQEIVSNVCKTEMDDDDDSDEMDTSKTKNSELADETMNDVSLENGHNTSTGSLKTFPLKFIDENCLKENGSRCTTPVNISTPMVNPRLKELAMVLIQVRRHF